MEYFLKVKIRILLFHVTLFLLVCSGHLNLLAATELPTNQKSSRMQNSGAKVLRFKKLTIEDGLSTSEVRTITQDHKGYIWIGTPAGLDRYDGSSIKQYSNDPSDKSSISGNIIEALIVDHQGRLWIATDRGLNRYNDVDDNFIAYRYDENKSDSISSDYITSLFEDSKQRLWIGTRAGFNIYDDEQNTFIRYQPDDNDPLNSFRPGNVESFHEDKEGMIWIGTISGSNAKHRGLTRFDPETKKFTHFDHDPENGLSLQKGSINSIFSTTDGRMWITSYRGGISEYLPSSNNFRRVSTIPGKEVELSATGNLTEKINRGFVDSRGTVWLITNGGGLLIFDPATDTFVQYTENINNPSGLSSNRLASIFEDRDGLIWVGTVSKGVNLFDYRTQRFNHLSPQMQLPQFNNSNIRSITELVGGQIIIGTSSQGLVIYNPVTNTFKRIFEKSIDGYISKRASDVVFYDKRKVLVASNQGVYTLDLDSYEKQYIPLLNHASDPILNIVAIYKSKDGIYWLLSAGNGLFSLDLKTLQITAFPFAENNAAYDDKTLSSYYPRDILEDEEGILWIATNRGLNRFDRTTNTFKHYVHDPKVEVSLPENKIFQILQQGNEKFWLATNNGLILFDKETESFKRFSTTDGLPNNNIYCMVGTNDYLWLATNDGLSRWHRESYTATNFYQEDGLGSNEFNTYGCQGGESGNLYFAGINGLNYFKPKDVSVESLPSPLLISEIKLENEKVQFSKNSVVNVPYQTSLIQLEFRALNYSAPELINYQIKLENFDKEWRNIGYKNNTLYTNLSAGKYIFRVKASNQYGIESEVAQVVFIKQNHPLLSAWAISFYILILLLGVAFYTVSHKRQLAIHKDIAKRERKLSQELRQLSVHLQNAREDERASVARELHDELAQILVAIKLEISWIQSALERQQSTQVIERMPEVNEIVDACVASVRNIATGLRPSVLDDMGLIPALDWYVRSICQRARLRRSFTTNCENIHLSKQLSINIYRIVQETVTNVIKHAEAKKIYISCYLKEQRFHLRVRDDGVGIKTPDMDKPGHYGLIGIRERVATYNGRVVISSDTPTGMIIDVTIPVTDDILENFPAPELG